MGERITYVPTGGGQGASLRERQRLFAGGRHPESTEERRRRLHHIRASQPTKEESTDAPA